MLWHSAHWLHHKHHLDELAGKVLQHRWAAYYFVVAVYALALLLSWWQGAL